MEKPRAGVNKVLEYRNCLGFLALLPHVPLDLYVCYIQKAYRNRNVNAFV